MPRGIPNKPAVDAAADAQTEAAPDGRLPHVKLVASVRGFYGGAMIEPGKSFWFDPNPSEPGAVVKWPKWAAEPGKKAEKLPPPDPKAFDTRPVAAVAAAKAKAGQRSGAIDG